MESEETQKARLEEQVKAAFQNAAEEARETRVQYQILAAVVEEATRQKFMDMVWDTAKTNVLTKTLFLVAVLSAALGFLQLCRVPVYESLTAVTNAVGLLWKDCPSVP